MSYFKQIEVIDSQGNLAQVTQSGSIAVTEPIRLAGQVCSGSQLDTNFWTATPTAGGTATQANGLQVLSTNTTANAAIQVVSTSKARFIGQSENQYVAQIMMGDTGTANNVRRWGVFDGTNGAYFKLSGTTLYIATVQGGVETAVASTSWNGVQTVPTLTALNTYKIEYRLKTVLFYINGALSHTVTGNALWSNASTLPIWHDNVNSGGSTTNVTMSIGTATIYRIGPLETQPLYTHITGAGTTVCKYSAGLLHRIVINTLPSSGSNTLTLYDNTAGSGTVIAVLTGGSTGGPVSIEYQVSFNTGFTVVSAGTAWDVTVIYQ